MTTETDKVNVVSKISTKTVCGGIKIADIIPKEGKEAKPIKIMKVYGIAKRIITGNTTFGDYIGFAGSFEAVNEKTKERFAAGKCFLPNIIADPLSAAFENKIESIRFGFDIAVKFDEAVPCKYVYSAQSLIKQQKDNPIALLRGEVEGKPPK